MTTKNTPDTKTLATSTMLIAEHLLENGDMIRSIALYQTASRLMALDCALRDAISTYDVKYDKVLVTAERQEAWSEALRK